MTEPPDTLRHCYRCVYSWRSVSPHIRMCPRCKSRLWNRPKLRPSTSRRRGLGIPEIVGPHRSEIRRLARRYGVASLRVFGSVARGEARRDSDVDLLVAYRRSSDIFTRAHFRRELEHLLRRKVDLVTEETLHWAVRPRAVSEGVLL